MTKRGRILRDTNSGPGLLTVEGTQYVFVLEGMWRSEIPPRPGMTVDVAFNSQGSPEAVFAVSESVIAKEQAQKAFTGVIRQSEAVKSTLRTRYPVASMVAEGLILLAFFFLPCMHAGPSVSRTSFTGWQVTGLDANTMEATDHGFMSLLALLCFFAPLAVPFVKRPWARRLNAAPFAFAILTFVTTVMKINDAAKRAFGGTEGLFGSNQMSQQLSAMFSSGLGTWMVLICAAYLLYLALRRSVA